MVNSGYKRIDYSDLSTELGQYIGMSLPWYCLK